jgi:creatinine amidohydrolase
MRTIRMENMNWPDIKSAIAKGYTTVVVGVGATEQHGHHLPLKTDAVIGDEYAYRIAKKLGNALHGPTIRVGCSDHHLAFPGTVTLKAATLKAVIEDYVESFLHHGFNKIIFIPSHGGNCVPLASAVEELQQKYPEIQILAYTDLLAFIDAQLKITEEAGLTRDEGGAHAGEIETSIILALEPDLVEKNRFEAGYMGSLGEDEVKIILERGMTALTQSGVLGDPTRADPDRGRLYLEKTVDFLVEEIKKLLGE